MNSEYFHGGLRGCGLFQAKVQIRRYNHHIIILWPYHEAYLLFCLFVCYENANDSIIVILWFVDCFQDYFSFLKSLFIYLLYIFCLLFYTVQNVSQTLGHNLLSFLKGQQYYSPKLFQLLFWSKFIHAYPLVAKDYIYQCSLSCNYIQTNFSIFF